MKHKKTVKVIIFMIAIALFLFIVTKVRADAPVYEIYNFEDLVNAASLSRQSGNQNYTFILKNDIEITEQNQTTLENSDFNYISFGSSDYPFAGVFDGQDHHISNLKYSSTLAPNSDTGLFSYTTTGAVIKNLTIIDADIQSDYRGGIISGHSEGTLFENIIIKDSHVFVSAINNVLTLITDGGIRGGAVVGEAENCVLYNCESVNTRVNTNSTSGVAALSGKGLYLGGLVGTAISTEVEYSRVMGGLVKNYYDVAVGALGGNTLYVGGIIGQMKNGSKVIDSFSTAELYYYCATYVSVGAGNSGHIGGIAAAMYGQTNEIIRCHYAGQATSRQYNAVLVVPIIQDNVNISGIADVYEGGSVVNTYFKPSVNDGVDMNVLGDSNSTSSYGPLTDERYIDKDYWQTQNYDFYGNIKRQSNYNNNHTNKWVMDNTNNIPIHGMSISASIDFTNAGTVTIGRSELVNSEVSTSDATLFAVQGFNIHEKTANIRAQENTGYRFVSWYKVPNVTVWVVDENHEFYDNAFNSNAVYSNQNSLNNISFDDNDLYAAYYQARVLFHNINGDIIDTTTGNAVQDVQESDWYDYLSDLPDVEPTIGPASQTARLIGWTTTMSNESGGGYSSITSPVLTSLKNNNTFYEPGDKITETLSLYPVYMDLISNINTVFEGNEQDSISDVSLRDNVGQTSVSMNANDEVVINVTGSAQNGAFPDGYRFLGWYDENNMRVSKNQEYILKDVDLSVTHTYTARFEYRVDYYVRAFVQNNGNSFTNSELYTSRWQEYNTPFDNIPGPAFIRETVTHWGTAHVNHGGTDNTSDSYSGNIVAPLAVYSHNYNIVSGNGTGYQVSMTMDFPGAGQIIDDKGNTGAIFRFTPVSNRYHLLFWTLEGERTLISPIEGWTYADNPMDTGTISSARTYKGMAMVTTDVNFYKKNGNTVSTSRRYESNIFLNADTTYTYKYPFYKTTDNVNTATSDSPSKTISDTITMQASPSNNEMNINGYVFLGWISTADIEKNGNVWNSIYDVQNDLYCTSDITKAKPYLLDGSELVYETQDLYPVYAKWNIVTKTNVRSLGGLYNTPPNPGYTVQNSIYENGKGIVTITPNESTYISGNSGAIYDLLELVRVLDDGTEEVIEKDNNDEFTYEVQAGKDYVFMAKYRPYTVIYHLNEGEVRIVIRNHLDTLGEMPVPTFTFSNNDYVLMGWTDASPDNGKYHQFQSYQSYQSEGLKIYNENTVVIEALELWPVYVRRQITINSNIDSILQQNQINPDSVRYFTRPSINQTQINTNINALQNYTFIGWYKNYQNNSNMGELLTNNATYIFENNESVENTTYTAVYVRTFSVNYYNTSEQIIYTANINENEQRTFVTEELDNNNNTIMVPIDSQAYEEIHNSLAPNEIFVNWQWQVNSETISQWDSFYNETITTNMDLYPIIIKVDMKDPDNNNIDITAGNNNDKICICLNSSYEKPYVSVHISKIAYGANSTYTEQNLNNIEIDLYKNNDISGEPIANGVTDANGNSTLYVFGEIVVTQNTSNQNNDVFIYQLLDTNNNVINEFNISLGDSKTLKVPYGRYKIKRKKSWSWRYAQVTSDVIVINNQNNNQEIIFEGNRVTNKWFDKSTYIDNEY